MKVFSNVIKRVRQATAKRLVLVPVLALTLSVGGIAAAQSLGFTNTIQNSNASSYCGDPSGNSIMRCGAANRAAFIAKVKRSNELQKIYAHFGLQSSDYSRFINSAQPGMAYSFNNKYGNNTIVVNGNVVATNVWSIGRWASFQGSGYRTVHIAGAGTYYGNYNTKAFASGTTAIPVDVLFNDKGQMQFAVMTSTCGNPTPGVPQSPNYACHNIISHQVGDNTYKFSVNADAGHGATIDKIVYDFGDGSRPAVTQHPGDTVTHTFTKSATVTATVYVKLPGGGEAKVVGGCKKKITFVPPAATFACDLLTLDAGSYDNKGNQKVTLTAKASAKNATVDKYTFTLGDGQGPVVVKTNKLTASTTHTYAPGNYNTKVDVTFTTDRGRTVTVSSNDCQKPLKVKALETALTCVELDATAGTPDQTTGNTPYTLVAKASTKNATVDSFVFNFGDNTSKTVNTHANSATVQHTYAPGDYQASVTVKGTDIYGHTITSNPPVCRKPIHVAPPEVPVLTCDSLSLTKGNVNPTTGATDYTLTAKASEQHVTIENYVFSFGDGSQNTTVTTSNTTASTTHTYDVGTWNAMVTVNGKDAAGHPLSATSPACKKTVNVPPVSSTLTCDSLSLVPGTVNADGSQAYTLNAAATAHNATINNYVFTFGDNSQAQTVTTNASTASTTHTYAPGTYVASVTVNGTDNAGHPVSATSSACQKPVTVTPPNTPSLTITKTVDGQPSEVVKLNTDYEYEVTVTNNGQVDLTNAVVTDVPEDGVVLVNEKDNLGTITNNQWTYTIPSLAKGQSMTFKFTAYLTKNTTDPVDNKACVSDTSVNNNQPQCAHATVSTTPVTPPTTLVNTGAGNVLGIFGASAIVGTLGYRFFLNRRLTRE